MMEYRKEIDGLRALAVLSVVFCHAGFPAFGGGFVGVDVFFVISGYLITSIIYREFRAGDFSLIRFYERRARRILPALFLVILVVTPFAWIVLWPADFRDYAKSLVYVVLFASNVHFYKEIGYFAPDVELRPLLHTWSLGVEEQYYILFPLLLMVCWRLRREWLALLLASLALLSLGVAEYGLRNFPDASFYLLPTRAWELLAGAIYAILAADRAPFASSPLAVRNLSSFAGLGMIVAAVVIYGPDTPFPGIHALLPVLGALLVIAAATPDTVVGTLLSIRPVLAVGLWSYSIYLWHQPLFALVRYREEAPGMLTMSALTAATLGLAYLGWRYVEMPFRRASWRGRRLLRFSLLGIVVFLAFGLVGKHRDDVLKRHAPGYEAQATVERQLFRNFGLSGECSRVDAGARCQTAADPDLMVWGDSYAMHLVDGILASRPDVRLIQRTRSACGPFPGIAPVLNGDLAEAGRCLVFNASVVELLGKTPSIRHVVLASPFSQYLTPANEILQPDGKRERPDENLLKQELLKTLAYLRSLGIEPVIFAPPPANGSDLGRCLARSVLLGRSPEFCDFTIEEISAENKTIHELLSGIGQETGVRVVWLHELLCPNGRCTTHAGATFLFLDEGHLTRNGSAHLGRLHDFHRLATGE